MKSKISILLMALTLLGGCSSGGGTDGAGGIGTAEVDGYLLSASLNISGDGVMGGANIDTMRGTCTDGVAEPFTTHRATFNLTIRNIGNLTGGIFPSDIILERYTVSYTPNLPSSGAPELSPRTHPITASAESGNTISVGIVIAEKGVGGVKGQFRAQNPRGIVYSYSIRVDMYGRAISGKTFRVAAQDFFQIGNFDPTGCGSGGGSSIDSSIDVFASLDQSGDDVGRGFSVDIVQGSCDGEPEPFTSHFATFNLNVRNIPGPSPSRIELQQYTVTYTPNPRGSGAPILSPRTYSLTESGETGETISLVVVIADLAETKREAHEQNRLGIPYSYNVNITMFGRTLSGEPFQVTVSDFFEFGDFNNC